MAGNVIPLDSILNKRAKGASGGGCSASSCGSNRAVSDGIWERIKDHPCFSEEAHHHFARMHVAVAPACNIQCNYCNRKFDCANESRPGVTSQRLSPEEAANKVLAVAARMPQLSVLGIAGPGDAMFDWRRTFATFAAVEKRLPDLKFCISTNGLALPDQIGRLADHNIDHVTITINTIDPDIGSRIYPWIYFNGRRHAGTQASRILIERQMEGLEALTARGILVKVNSVMIPGINDDHLAAVNAAVTARGAFLHNITPLISDPAHGTRFGLDGQRGPNPAELKALQDRLEGGARLMRHCRQCRADAVGMLGEDLSQDEAIGSALGAPEIDLEARRLYREVVGREMDDRRRAKEGADMRIKSTSPSAQPRLVAVCSKGGGRINQHFGHAEEFQIYEVDPNGVRLSGLRRAANYCQGGDGDDDRLAATIAMLDGIDTIFAAKIGRCPRKELAAAGITVIEDYAFDYIETALAAWFEAGVSAHKIA